MAKGGFGSGFGNWPKIKLPKALKPTKPEKPKNTLQAAHNKELAIQAGKSGVCLSLRYDGLPRTVEVQVVGTSKADRPAMRVYQVDGQSNSTPAVDWRLLCFDECFDVALTDRKAAPPRSNNNRWDKGFNRIDWYY